ncbi:MAG: sugar transferase [Candidatus Eutrophobiaceae bacterium]
MTAIPPWKRCVDIGAGLVLLVSMAMPLAALCVLVGYNYGRPVFFRQTRLGYMGKPFDIVKLRTMKDARDPSGDPLPDEQRLGLLGRWLRSWSLDELPSLWNVLKGEMSIIGPRPLLPEYLPLYTPEQNRRHEVLPGLTGWAQIHGRNALGWEERFRLDVWYVDHCSFFVDLRILLRTVFLVLRRENIHKRGYATMPKFTGSKDILG